MLGSIRVLEILSETPTQSQRRSETKNSFQRRSRRPRRIHYTSERFFRINSNDQAFDILSPVLHTYRRCGKLYRIQKTMIWWSWDPAVRLESRASKRRQKLAIAPWCSTKILTTPRLDGSEYRDGPILDYCVEFFMISETMADMFVNLILLYYNTILTPHWT